MMTFLVVLVIAVAVAGLFWILRGHRTPQRHRGRPAPTAAPAALPGGLDKLRNNDLFWGVQISHAGCAAAQSLQDQQYPFDAAPQLPLPDCDSANCTCQFKGLTDRRANARRNCPDRRNEIRFGKDHLDRRAPEKGRRRGDKWGNRSY